MRSEGRHSAELTVRPAAFEGELEEDESGALELSVRQRVAEVSMADDSGTRAREEIAEMQEILSEYGFSFFDLAEASPKAEKTKRSCGTAIRTLVASVILMAAMRLKRLLPVKELSEKSGVVRKILDRHRKYIIASAEILDGDFPILASYLSYVKEENG
jgi:RNA polymerase sigma factor